MIADAVDPSTISLGVAAVQIIINDNDSEIYRFKIHVPVLKAKCV